MTSSSIAPMSISNEAIDLNPAVTKTTRLTKSENEALRARHLGPNYEEFFKESPLHVVRAQGSYMFDPEGKKYLDCINNLAHVGHCHPRVVEAVSQQFATQATNLRYLHDSIAILAKRMADSCPGDLSVCYFVNSGSEANDLALRIARAYSGGTDMIVIENSYHGHLQSCIEISPYKFNRMTGGKPDHIHTVSCPDSYRGPYRDTEFPEAQIPKLYADQVGAVISEGKANGRQFAGFIAESIQSCGGQVVFPDGYMREVYEYVHAAGALCIADEVQVGFGRVGSHYWAFEMQGPGAIPDIVTIGKPMGNGFPVAAVITTPKIAKIFAEKTKVKYFNTFGGNPVACAAALAVMDVVQDEDLQLHAARTGEYLLEELRSLIQEFPFIGCVRGVGLMLGIDVVEDPVSRHANQSLANQIKRQLYLHERVIVSTDGPFDNVLKIKPPMSFNKADCDWLVTSLRTVCKYLAAYISDGYTFF